MPTVVEDAIKNGISTKDPIPGRLRHYSAENTLTVVTDGKTGRVITTMYGQR